MGCSSVDAVAVNSMDHVFASCTLGVFCSLDDGTTWTLKNNGLGIPVGSTGIYASPADVLFFSKNVNSPKLYRSWDNADIWTALVTGIEGWQSILTFPDALGSVLAANIGGVFITGNLGDEWWPMNDGLGLLQTLALEVDQSGSALAGTKGGGVFHVEFPSSIPGCDPVAHSHDQNMPNPCSTTTTINYHLNGPSKVSITVFDAQAREALGSREYREGAGNHSITLDVSSLEPGVYFYSLMVEGRRQTKRLVVAR